MDGNVVLRGGELYHLQRSFYIREGMLQFNGNDPKVDPLINARAEVRDSNDDGPVTIIMVMENVPLSELEKTMPRYESIPSLSQLEIYSLLGQAPSMDADAAAPDVGPLLRSTTEMILQTVVFRRAEQIIRNSLGLDMFSFRTQVLQNAVFEAVRNRDPNEQPATVGNYLDNTTVFMGKYFLPDLFGQLMVTFRYDPYQKEYGGMRPELDLGLDFQTPLFDVRWNIHPENPGYLATDKWMSEIIGSQSISLVWRWSL